MRKISRIRELWVRNVVASTTNEIEFKDCKLKRSNICTIKLGTGSLTKQYSDTRKNN